MRRSAFSLVPHSRAVDALLLTADSLTFAEIHMPLPLNITDDAELKCLLQRLADEFIEYQYQFI